MFPPWIIPVIGVFLFFPYPNSFPTTLRLYVGQNYVGQRKFLVIEYLITVCWLPTLPPLHSSSLLHFIHTPITTPPIHPNWTLPPSTSHKQPKIYSMLVFLEKFLALFSLFSLALSASISGNVTSNADLPYGYSGATGPNLWHKMSPQWKECATSKQQSPINIRATTATVKGSKFLYPASPLFEIFYDAYALRVQLTPNSFQQFTAVLGGQRYKLVQFHFQLPGEHTLEGEYFPLEIHFVHESVDGEFFLLYVVGEKN